MRLKGLGIVRIGLGHPWYLGYGTRGWGRWLPYTVQRVIVTLWNRAICVRRGHVEYRDGDDAHYVPCLHCGKK